MEQTAFTAAQVCPIRANMTVSRSARLGESAAVTWFSMGAHTTISRESYDSPTLYLGGEGQAAFLVGEPARKAQLAAGDLLVLRGGTLCGVQCPDGAVYTEIIAKKEIIMNDIVKSGETIHLKDLISYEEDSIANLDLAKNDSMKFVLMAFDAGTGLQPHRAPGAAIVTALEGKAIIGYEGKEYAVSAGDSFRFDKNGLHSVTADERFKMSLLLVLE